MSLDKNYFKRGAVKIGKTFESLFDVSSLVSRRDHNREGRPLILRDYRPQYEYVRQAEPLQYGYHREKSIDEIAESEKGKRKCRHRANSHQLVTRQFREIA